MTKEHRKWVDMYLNDAKLDRNRWILGRGVCEIELLPPSNADEKNEWNFVSISSPALSNGWGRFTLSDFFHSDNICI